MIHTAQNEGSRAHVNPRITQVIISMKLLYRQVLNIFIIFVKYYPTIHVWHTCCDNCETEYNLLKSQSL